MNIPLTFFDKFAVVGVCCCHGKCCGQMGCNVVSPTCNFVGNTLALAKHCNVHRQMRQLFDCGLLAAMVAFSRLDVHCRSLPIVVEREVTNILVAIVH